ncbi:MAG: hypothetical protein ACRYG4_13985, partial [Janthinobacterium lividum]
MKHTPPFAPATLRPREDGWTPDRQRIFIERLGTTGSVKSACRSAGMDASSAYRLRQHPSAWAFSDAWEAARSVGLAQITDIAIDRAVFGQKQEVFQRGELVGMRTIFDNKLLMFLLLNRGRLADNRFHQPLYAVGGEDGEDAPESADDAYAEALVALDVELEGEEAAIAAAEAALDAADAREADAASATPPASCGLSGLPTAADSAPSPATPDHSNSCCHPGEGRDPFSRDGDGEATAVEQPGATPDGLWN